MLYLISCDKDLVEILRQHEGSFVRTIYVRRVSDTMCMYVHNCDDVFYTNVFAVHSTDGEFIVKLKRVYSEFICHLQTRNSSRVLTLYRWKGTMMSSYYRDILESIKKSRGMKYKILYGVLTYCKTCPNCDFPAPLIWIETEKMNHKTFGSAFEMNFQLIDRI